MIFYKVLVCFSNRILPIFFVKFSVLGAFINVIIYTFICIDFKWTMIISSAMWIFGRRSRKLGLIQEHVAVVTCSTSGSRHDTGHFARECIETNKVPSNLVSNFDCFVASQNLYAHPIPIWTVDSGATDHLGWTKVGFV